jgi:hypothetical protein
VNLGKKDRKYRKHTAIESSSGDAQRPMKNPMPRVPNRTLQANYQGTSANINWKKWFYLMTEKEVSSKAV